MIFLTAYIVLSMKFSDIPLIEAGQPSAPICIEYCEVIQ